MHLRIEIFVDGERPASQQHARIANIFRRTPPRRNRQGYANYFGKNVRPRLMLILRMFGIKSEERNVMLARQLLEYLKTADLAPGIGRQQASGFDPQKLHMENSSEQLGVLPR